MQPVPGKDWDWSKVRQCTEAIARRVDFLLERLASIEADSVSGCALIRSSAPSARGERKEYYELKLDRGGSVSLERKPHHRESRIEADPAHLDP